MITLMSWGFKFGRPPANFVFDTSFLKNPWRVPELRDASPDKIISYMESQDEFKEVVDAFANLIMIMNTFFPKENLVFAFCCSAGEYRSPVVVSCLYKELSLRGIDTKMIQGVNSKLKT